MKTTTKIKKRFAIGLILGVALIGSVFAFAKTNTAFSFSDARPQVTIKLDATLTRDNQTVNLGDIDSVKPGEVLHWTIASENNGDGNAQQYKAVGKIPSGTEFVANSTKADGAPVVTYSIDEKNFSKEPMIEEKQVDGSGKLVPAPVSMYKQIRFEWEEPLHANEKLNASYDVRVK